jgi:signal peptidase I
MTDVDTADSGDGRDARDPASSEPEASHAKRTSKASQALRETALLVVIALALSVVVRAFLVQAFFIPSPSMVPTLQEDDRILVSKITTRLAGVDRGQIVVFKDPGGWLTPVPDTATGFGKLLKDAFTFVGLLPSDTGDDLVKRVIGVGGDRVQCCDDQGRVVVNGVSLDEPYTNGAPGVAFGGCRQTFDVVVPEDHLWVMGDNRAVSEDSRCHADLPTEGFVPEDAVIGRAFVIVWPLSRVGLLRVPDTFDQPGLDA